MATKQGYLPGTEPPTIDEIDQAAEHYYELTDKSFKMRRRVDQAKEELLELMLKHDLMVYEFNGKEVLVIDKTTVKVKKKKHGENGRGV